MLVFFCAFAFAAGFLGAAFLAAGFLAAAFLAAGFLAAAFLAAGFLAAAVFAAGFLVAAAFAAGFLVAAAFAAGFLAAAAFAAGFLVAAAFAAGFFAAAALISTLASSVTGAFTPNIFCNAHPKIKKILREINTAGAVSIPIINFEPIKTLAKADTSHQIGELGFVRLLLSLFVISILSYFWAYNHVELVLADFFLANSIGTSLP